MTPQSELGKVVGEILSKASGTSYWDNPFQVTSVKVSLSFTDLKFYPNPTPGLLGRCETLQRKSEDDISTQTVGVIAKLPVEIPSCLQCEFAESFYSLFKQSKVLLQNVVVSTFQEFHSISDINNVIAHCSRVSKTIIRTSRIRIRDLMLIKVC